MSLATRCTSCNTVFKVVQDQLKVSKGWVRCGRCDTVFNALEELFELNGDTIIGGMRQPRATASAAPTAEATNAPAPQADQANADTGENTENGDRQDTGAAPFAESTPDAQDEFSRSLFGPHRKGPEQTPADLVQHRDRNEFADAQFDSDLLADDEGPGQGAIAATPATGRKKSGAPYSPPQPSDDTPAFVRHADAQARWKSPRARLLLSMACVFLSLGLGLQIAHHFRDRLAVEMPASEPLLSRWCGWVGCAIEPYRSIKDFSVETTALTRLPSVPDVFRLSVTLRNRGGVSLRLPSVDLSVTDAGGQLIARKTLTPTDFQSQGNSVKPNTDVPLQVLLKSTNPRINGYTVEIFYP